MPAQIGQPIRRQEDERLLTGRGEFSDDHGIGGQAHAVMVRSPVAHARIRSIDKTAAAAMPGVLGVFTGADCDAAGIGPIPHSPFPSTQFDMKLHAPGSAAARVSTTAGSGSKSIVTASAASAAWARVSATTMTRASPT